MLAPSADPKREKPAGVTKETESTGERAAAVAKVTTSRARSLFELPARAALKCFKHTLIEMPKSTSKLEANCWLRLSSRLKILPLEYCFLAIRPAKRRPARIPKGAGCVLLDRKHFRANEEARNWSNSDVKSTCNDRARFLAKPAD